MNEKKYFENKELEPKHNIVTAFLLRHGQSEYKENKNLSEDELLVDGECPNDLTPEGEIEVRKTAEKIANQINPEKDVVILWSSPKWRAQNSEKIIKEELKKRGISIYKDSSIGLMKDMDQYDVNYTNKMWKEINDSHKSTDLMYARDPKFQEKNDKFETQPEVKKRAELFFSHVYHLAESMNLKGKRLCIIGASHFEFLNPIMEDIFGSKVEQGLGISKGEEIVINFDYNLNVKDMKISADFRGEHKTDISFNKENRHFKSE